MRYLLLLMVVTVLGCAQPESAKLACNLNGLSSAERRESRALLGKLEGAVVEMKELDDGYAFRLDESKLAWSELSRWIDLERRCCPFFHFAAEVTEDRVWLRLTGAPGVKDLIQSKLGS